MKKKWYKVGAVAAMLIITLVSSVIWTADKDRSDLKVVKCADDLTGAKVGGVKSYMGPEASAVYFQSIIGRDISSYKEYDSFEDAVEGLKEGEIDALWGCDVTADYAVKRYEDLAILDSSDMAATANLKEPRFEFAFAMPDNDDGEKMQKTLSGVIESMTVDGTITILANDYIKNAAYVDPFYPKNMWSRTDRFRSGHEMDGKITIGVTGSAPPLELIDEDGKPYGFCVALADEMSCRLCTDVEIEVLDTETAFSQLMAGRVDALFAGAKSGNTTQEDKKFLTTCGYYTMRNYRFIVRSAQEDAEK
ncbi:MAG: transporter substrate-binding domain-containing protein [Lachnospiraceae bacterium]|nr:transporter substrate-binding domain-containing protein [Lachnospiraceae bacterium]